jgi:hypothetical protein
MSLSDGVNIGIMEKWKPDPNSIIGFNKSILDYLDTVAGLVEKETVMFVTSTHWAQIATAVKMMHPEAKIDPSNFNRLKILKLTVVNSRSEDQMAVDIANDEAAKDADFQNIRARKRTG